MSGSKCSTLWVKPNGHRCGMREGPIVLEVPPLRECCSSLTARHTCGNQRLTPLPEEGQSTLVYDAHALPPAAAAAATVATATTILLGWRPKSRPRRRTYACCRSCPPPTPSCAFLPPSSCSSCLAGSAVPRPGPSPLEPPPQGEWGQGRVLPTSPR